MSDFIIINEDIPAWSISRIPFCHNYERSFEVVAHGIVELYRDLEYTLKRRLSDGGRTAQAVRVDRVKSLPDGRAVATVRVRFAVGNGKEV